MTIISLISLIGVGIKNGILYLLGKLLKQSKGLKEFMGIGTLNEFSEEESRFEIERILYLIGSLIQILAIINVIIQIISVFFIANMETKLNNF